MGAHLPWPSAAPAAALSTGGWQSLNFRVALGMLPGPCSLHYFRFARNASGTSRKMLTSVSLVVLKVFPELRPGPTELPADENFVIAGHCAVHNAVAIRHMAGQDARFEVGV